MIQNIEISMIWYSSVICFMKNMYSCVDVPLINASGLFISKMMNAIFFEQFQLSGVKIYYIVTINIMHHELTAVESDAHVYFTILKCAIL